VQILYGTLPARSDAYLVKEWNRCVPIVNMMLDAPHTANVQRPKEHVNQTLQAL